MRLQSCFRAAHSTLFGAESMFRELLGTAVDTNRLIGM